MVLNRRGMFFTIMAILLLSLFVVSYGFYSTLQNRESITERVNTMESFLFSVEENFERELYAFGFRTIFLAEEKIASTGDYIPSMDALVQEAFFYGMFDGENASILEGVNYDDLLDSVKRRAGKINVDVNFSNPEISIRQDDPWYVVFSISFDLEVVDKANLSSWKRRQNVESYVDIEGFEDPSYLIGTNGKVANKINRTVYVFPISSASSLLDHCENGYYTASTTAPSFLDKLEGQTSANVNGIESLVYLPRLSAQGISTQSKSVVDYIYFSGDNPSSQTVAGMPSWFRLDDSHVGIYVS